MLKPLSDGLRTYIQPAPMDMCLSSTSKPDVTTLEVLEQAMHMAPGNWVFSVAAVWISANLTRFPVVHQDRWARIAVD